MSEPEISPLARRLAEENNVEWRGLRGSGAGGKVVERDVLEYLARVMAGDEDLDPTPEPVPEGMEAWPDDDLGDFQRGLQGTGRRSGLDDIQRELSASDRSLGTAPESDGPSAAGVAQDDTADLEEISEDIFLFDDDDGTGDLGDTTAFGAASRAPIDDLDDDLLIAGDDTVATEADDDTVEDEKLWSGASAASEPDTLPDIFGEAPESTDVADDEAPDLFAEPATDTTDGGTTPELDIPSFDDLDMTSVHGVEAAAVEASADDEASASGGPRSDLAAMDRGADVDAVGSASDTGRLEEFDDGHEARESGALEAAGSPAADADEPAAQSVSGRDLGQPHAGTTQDTTPSAGPGRDLAGPAPDADEVVDLETELGVAAAATPAASEPWLSTVESGEPESEVAAAMPQPHDVPLVSFGSLLRRHLDLTALASAQLAVSQEFGHEEPLPPTAFLVRAAAKAMVADSWEPSPLLLASFSETGLRLADVGDRARGSFRMLLEAVTENADDARADGAALVVADMSGLEVDEAVLNLGAPVLTLGRILYDNQRGSYRSTLAISGDMAAERGAKLLATVAELLDAPIRLVL